MMISRRTGRRVGLGGETAGVLQRRVKSVRVSHGTASAQGQRKTMEDAHVSGVLRLPRQSCMRFDDKHGVHFHAVFDGHGGSDSSEYLSKHLLPMMEQFLTSESSVEVAIKKAFQRTDEMFLKTGMSSGSTCIAVLIEEISSTAWIINVGDSRCVLNSGFSTKDHKPSNPAERERIELAGGCVINQRVSGMLAVSRAFGDRIFRPYVISEPDITKIKLKETDKFAILACDGLWDVLSNDLACRLVEDGLLLGAPLDTVCWGLVTAAINERHSLDNVSVTLLKLGHSF